MGGTALGKQATSLTTPQFEQLAAHCRSSLSDLFSEIRVEYCPRDKLAHGDLDLLCAWDGAGDDHVGGMDRSAKPNVETNALRSLCEEIATKIGGTEWVRTDRQICIAVPSRVFDAGAGFFQVDVNLLPSASLDMALLVMSYRSNIVILPRIVQALSPSLILNATRLKLRHTGFPGLPPVEFTLTTSARELCEWLGLSWCDFTIFNTEPDLYRWFTDVPPESLVGGVWQRVLRGEVMPKKKGHGGRKLIGWDLLVQWLRDESGYAQMPTPPPTPAAHDDGPAGMIPLDPMAMEAVERWGKVEAFERGSAGLTAEAKRLMARRRV